MKLQRLAVLTTLLLAAASPTSGAAQGALEQCYGALPTILGTPRADILRGTPGDDVIAGLGGDDLVIGDSGEDILCGGSGADILQGGPGDDGIVTGSGRDRAFGEEGRDHLTEVTEGGSGPLLVNGEMEDSSSDVLSGGPGFDWLAPEGGDDVVYGGAGVDLVDMLWVFDPVAIDLQLGVVTSTNGGTEALVSVEGAAGGLYADVILGSERSDWLAGMRGADHIDGRGGGDLLWSSVDGARLIGGDDQTPDTVWPALSEPMMIDLTTGTVSSLNVDHGHPADKLVGIENAVGTPEDDVIVGTALDNFLYGSEGDDSIQGGPGDDRLWGDGPIEAPLLDTIRTGGGFDRLDGGLGNDELDGGAKDDECTGGETVRSCESEQLTSRSFAADKSSTWLFPGPQPWWWSSIDRFALHPN